MPATSARACSSWLGVADWATEVGVVGCGTGGEALELQATRDAAMSRVTAAGRTRRSTGATLRTRSGTARTAQQSPAVCRPDPPDLADLSEPRRWCSFRRMAIG